MVAMMDFSGDGRVFQCRNLSAMLRAFLQKRTDVQTVSG
jgi:hypothetical protein